ncbi:MAG: PAS domain-containing protein, partial [Gemmatimonadaceae bacterium]|nr:PAS domain-containing protein [Gemmatimonadaceae bacterium]
SSTTTAWLEPRERGFVEQLPVPTLLMDLDRMSVVLINAEFRRLLGYSEAEIAAMGGALVERIVHPDDHAMLAERFTALFAAADGEVVESQFRARHADGRWRWARTRNAVFSRHPDGRARSMLTVAFDDSDRIEAFAAVERSAQRLAEAQRVGHVGSWTWDPTSGALVWSDEMFHIWGLDPQRGAPSYADFLRTIPEPDRTQMDRGLRDMLAGSGETFRIDHRLVRPDGRELSIQCRGRIERDAAGAPQRVTGSSQDVSELRQALDAAGTSEARYRLAASVTTDVLYDFLIAGDRVSWNAAMTRVFGHRLDADGGTSLAWWASLIHPDDRARVQDSLDAALAATDDRWQDEYRFRRADGQYALVLDRASIMRDPEGRATRLIGSMIDETARRALEVRVRQTATLDALGTLAGGIAHDFNNILTSIFGFAELAAADVAPESEAQESLRKIVDASHRARELVQRILAFTRRDEQVRQAVPLAALLDDTMPLVRASLPSTLQLVAEIERATPLVTEGDRLLLQQGIVNLCVNAEHATRGRPAPMVTITLTATALDGPAAARQAVRPGRYARLTVRDNGEGMAPQVVERVFDPFFTTKPVGEGTGLGLSLVHGTVTSAGGTIEIASTPGVGTEVAILLPVQRDPSGG